MYKSFIKEYDKYKDKIYNHFYYRVSFNVDIAEDLTSETFLKAYESYQNGGYDDNYSFSTWIYTIATNILTDYYRKNGREVLIEEDEQYSDDYSIVENLELEIDTKLDFEVIKKEIDKLSRTQKECIVLKFIDGMSYEEISEIIGKKQDNIRKNISRGIKKIKNNLEKNKKYYYEQN